MAYTITGRKCGTVRFEPETVGNIQTEQVSMSSKVTSNPIESGGDINDHVIKDPMKFTISGVIIGGQQAQSLHRQEPRQQPRHNKPHFRRLGQERERLLLQSNLSAGQHIVGRGCRGWGLPDNDAAGQRQKQQQPDTDQEDKLGRPQDHRIEHRFQQRIRAVRQQLRQQARQQQRARQQGDAELQRHRPRRRGSKVREG